jgi:hypothetical protein
VTVSKQQVIAALAELRVNRPRLAADRMIRGYLQRFGNGASSVGELDPAHYESVWRAAGGSISYAEFYGTLTDIPRARRVPVAAPSSRIRTPMVAELEDRLAARAGKPRSKPNYVVNVGNPAQPGDEDAPRQYPNDGRRVS